VFCFIDLFVLAKVISEEGTCTSKGDIKS
jgi:hypothetical protein